MNVMTDKPKLYVIIENEQSYIGRECTYNSGSLDAYTDNKYIAELYTRQFKRCHFSIYEIDMCNPKDIISNIIKKYGRGDYELCSDFTDDYKLFTIISRNNPDVNIITTRYNYDNMGEWHDSAITDSAKIMMASINNISILSRLINNNLDLLRILEVLKFYVIRYTILINMMGDEIKPEKKEAFRITEDSDVYEAADLDYIYMLIFMDSID